MVKKILGKYYKLFNDNKKFILIYLLMISILTIPMFSNKNIANPKMEICSFIFIFIVGCFLILYGFKNKNCLHKVAFVFIIVMGILISFFAPPFSIFDEAIHFARLEYMVNGHLFSPSKLVYINNYYWPMFEHLLSSYEYGSNHGIYNLIFNNPGAFVPISSIHLIYPSKITLSPFYSYILPSIGVIIAKYLNLDVIWALVLSRLFALIFYAGCVYWAIKKVPVYKMPLLFFSCTPLILSIAPSSGYDSFIFACFFIIIACFIRMFKNKVKNIDLFIFFTCLLLIGVIKPQYLLFSLLIFFIPHKNFKFKYKTLTLIIFICILGLSTFLLYEGVNMFVGALPGISKNNSSMIGQINYILANPSKIIDILVNSLYFFFDRILINNYYYQVKLAGGLFKGSKVFNILYFTTCILFSIFYPLKIRLDKYKKIILGLGFIIFYVSMFFFVYIIWNRVGSPVVWGNQTRYYIPLALLLPLAINHPYKRFKNIDLYTITFIVIFMAGLFMLTITHFY